ncbi:unnamed protein product [Polarella glacialis]|uniref:Uncharacterized protein n=1 Tax=Polarella glacialis TaxID=89957 RepID=A0A813H3B1_POLGL|nr:unnamed protein product [Polarella glacialis]
MHGSGGQRIQLLMVCAVIGVPQETGTRVDKETRAMKMPRNRPDGRMFSYVRAGPHRPFYSGPGTVRHDGDDASVIYIVYRPGQMYPEYIITMEVPIPAVCLNGRPSESQAEVETGAPPPKRLCSSPSGSGASRPAAATKTDHGKLNVSVVSDSEGGPNIVEFRIKISTPFAKMMSAWCAHHKVSLVDVCFKIVGRILKPEETPESCGWTTPAQGTLFINADPVYNLTP